MASRLSVLSRRIARSILPPSTVEAIRRRRGRRRMDRREVLYKFWRQAAPEHNAPQNYIPMTGRSAALLEIIADLPKETRILEVGCNVGRNLAYLHDNGYQRVEGIEINPHAVAMLRETYPQLADAPIHIGPAEEVLPTLEKDGYGLVFTMAVLEHIHPDSEVVFDEMVRVGRSILSIEPPGVGSHRQFPHDVPKIFQSRGLRLASARPMSDFQGTAKDRAISHYTAYRFTRG